jgi:UrcA family protein
LISQQFALSAEPSVLARIEGREPIAFAFRFKSTDLATAEGARQVYLALGKKAKKACTIKDVPGSRIQRVDRQCVAELITTVVQRVASSALAEQHSRTLVAAAGRGGQPGHDASRE